MPFGQFFPSQIILAILPTSAYWDVFPMSAIPPKDYTSISDEISLHPMQPVKENIYADNTFCLHFQSVSQPPSSVCVASAGRRLSRAGPAAHAQSLSSR